MARATAATRKVMLNQGSGAYAPAQVGCGSGEGRPKRAGPQSTNSPAGSTALSGRAPRATPTPATMSDVAVNRIVIVLDMLQTVVRQVHRSPDFTCGQRHVRTSGVGDCESAQPGKP